MVMSNFFSDKTANCILLLYSGLWDSPDPRVSFFYKITNSVDRGFKSNIFFTDQ